MVNNEAASILVEYSQHIAHYAAIADVPEERETVLTTAAREHAWRLLAEFTKFAEATKESDMCWQLLDIAVERGKSDRECYRLRTIAKSEDRKFMDCKDRLAKLLKEIRATEKADPTGKKRQAAQEKQEREAAENKAYAQAVKKEQARLAREARKQEKLAAAQAEAKAATSKAKTAAKKVKVAA